MAPPCVFPDIEVKTHLLKEIFDENDVTRVLFVAELYINAVFKNDVNIDLDTTDVEVEYRNVENCLLIWHSCVESGPFSARIGDSDAIWLSCSCDIDRFICQMPVPLSKVSIGVFFRYIGINDPIGILCVFFLRSFPRNYWDFPKNFLLVAPLCSAHLISEKKVGNLSYWPPFALMCNSN